MSRRPEGVILAFSFIGIPHPFIYKDVMKTSFNCLYRFSLTLSLLIRMCAVVDLQRGSEYLDESLRVLCGPSVLHLTIFAEFRLRQVVIAVYAYGLETVRTQL